MLLLFQAYWILPLLVWLLVLIVKRVNNYALYVAIALSLVTGIVHHHSSDLQHCESKGSQRGLLSCVVLPDTFRVFGTTLSAEATLADGENCRFSYQLRNRAELEQFEGFTTPILLDAYAKIELIQPTTNKLTFDRQRYWESRGIRRNLVVKDIRKIRYATPTNLFQAISWQVQSVHRRLVLWFEECPNVIRDYGQTLFLGVMREDFFSDNGGIKELGLLHLFSISGFQVDVAYAIWLGLTKRLSMTRESTLLSVQVVLILLWCFAGGVQSLIRPIMFGILTAWRGLRWITISRADAWGMTLLVGVCVEPAVLGQLGGQLSYLLSFGLLWLIDKPSWWRSTFLGALITPLILWHTGVFHPLSLIVNVIAVPVFSMFVIPLICLGAVASVSQLEWLANFINVGLGTFQSAVSFIGDVSPEVVVGRPLIGTCAVMMIGTLAVLYGRLRIGAMVWTSCLLMTMIWHTLSPVGTVTFFDIGQGDATLIRQPGGKTVMVDVGGSVKPKPTGWSSTVERNFQAEMLASYCRLSGIQRINTLILTHKDTDHIGNFSAFSNEIKVNQVLIPAGMLQTGAGRRLKHPNIQEVTAAKCADFDILHPFRSGDAENEDSVVLSVQTGPKRSLFPGDLDKAGELAVIEKWPSLRAGILKFGHHGSRTSSAPEFVKVLGPEYGIVSAGRRNRFGHPHAPTLQTANDYKMKVWSTAVHGMIEYKWLNRFDWWEVKNHGDNLEQSNDRR